MSVEYGKDYRDTARERRAVWAELGLLDRQACQGWVPQPDCPKCNRVLELHDTLNRLREALEREAP